MLLFSTATTLVVRRLEAGDSLMIFIKSAMTKTIIDDSVFQIVPKHTINRDTYQIE